MPYFREVLYLQTKNDGCGVGYIKRDQNGMKRRERIVMTAFPQTGIGEYQGKIFYDGDEEADFTIVLREGRGEMLLESGEGNAKLPPIYKIEVAGIVIYENNLMENTHVEAKEEYIPQITPKVQEEECRKEETCELKPGKEPAKEIKSHPTIRSKWDHICSIYPRKEPFADGKQFVQVRLEDFVILSEDCYRLAQNSFLLHGYYNYGYLVLYRNGEGEYYMGTPGNFYEKEKEVAILYDFTHFECKDDNATEGTFGYYMIPVKL